jgi:hypothetical protein
MNQTEGLPFRSFVPLIIACLEDADPGVRETAKTAVVELFRCVTFGPHIERGKILTLWQ